MDINNSYMLDTKTTLGNLKEKFSTIYGNKSNNNINIEDICAWTESGTPLVNNDNTLEQYNLAYDDIIINMATEWSEKIKPI
jgi:hypothetical protein